MKLKITFLAVAVSAPIFTFAATQYVPSRIALRAQAVDTIPYAYYSSDEYRRAMETSMRTTPTAPMYMMPGYAAPAAPVPYVMPAITPVSAPTANTTPSGNITAKDITADKIEVKGELKVGKDSVYIGSDKVGNYIKATGTATKNLLRIMIGTTTSNAKEVMRILANGYIGIGTTNPGIDLHIVDNDSDGNAGVRFDAKSAIGVMQTIDNGNEGTELVVASHSSGLKGSKMTFITGDTGRLSHQTTIDPNGNVGIGTINPRIRLDIKDDVNYVNSGLRIAGRYTEAVIRTIGSNVIISANKILGITDPSGVTPGGFSFETTDQWGALRNPLMILSDGKVKFNNQICLPDGTSPSSTVSKCFRYACPNPGGLGWILSDVLCSQLGKG